jgi:ATP-dependent Clp protease protease subunit
MPEVGRKAETGKEHTQSVVFEKEAGWTKASSRKWIKSHDYYDDGLDETETQWRWRQYDPDDSEFDYRTQVIVKDSVSLILGIPKDQASDENVESGSVPQGGSKTRPYKQPIRCIEGNAKPHEPFWSFTNVINGDGDEETTMELYGFISEYSWFEDDITPKMFRDDLYKYGNGRPVLIKLNSYGGDVFAASMMRAIILDYPGYVTVRVDGIAASAATIVALSGKRLLMQESAYMMIHDPIVSFCFACLNIDDLYGLLNELETIKDGILDSYMNKTGMSKARLGHMMSDETWMTARQAVDLKFADEVISAPGVPISNQAAYVNMAPGRHWTKTEIEARRAEAANAVLRNYAHVPEEVRKTFISEGRVIDPPIQTQFPENEEYQREVERLRCEAKILI